MVKSNLLLQGVSWLHAGSGRDFAFPPLQGSAQYEPCPKQLSDPHHASFLFFLCSVAMKKYNERLIGANGTPGEGPMWGIDRGLPGVCWTVSKAICLGDFDCFPLLSYIHGTFSFLRSFLFYSRSHWLTQGAGFPRTKPHGKPQGGRCSHPKELLRSVELTQLGQGVPVRRTAKMQAGTSRETTVGKPGVQR